ncbi:MAG: CidA/LrgA family holin-like protein [Tumebacillaceae bacterium]
MKKVWRIVWQVALLGLMSWVGNLISTVLHLPIPGSIVGLVLLFLLLKFGVIRMEWVEAGANFLLAELLLFFIPSTVGVIQYQNLASQAPVIVLVIGLSTLAVMAVTGVTAELVAKIRRGETDEHRVRS